MEPASSVNFGIPWIRHRVGSPVSCRRFFRERLEHGVLQSGLFGKPRNDALIEKILKDLSLWGEAKISHHGVRRDEA